MKKTLLFPCFLFRGPAYGLHLQLKTFCLSRFKWKTFIHSKHSLKFLKKVFDIVFSQKTLRRLASNVLNYGAFKKWKSTYIKTFPPVANLKWPLQTILKTMSIILRVSFINRGIDSFRISTIANPSLGWWTFFDKIERGFIHVEKL